MSIQDRINAAAQDVKEATERLATSQAALAAAIPHLNVLAELESMAPAVDGAAREAFLGLITKARELF